MQTLALISFYAPVVIIILAVLAILFSFLLLGFPAAGAPDVERNGPTAGSILALARAATTAVMR